MSLAVIKTGGKQYLIKAGDKIKVEKLDAKQGEKVEFGQVLLMEKNKKIELGAPFIKDAKVIGKVAEQGKDKKIIVLKYKSKTRYKIKKGHRQPFTEVEITKIN